MSTRPPDMSMSPPDMSMSPPDMSMSPPDMSTSPPDVRTSPPDMDSTDMPDEPSTDMPDEPMDVPPMDIGTSSTETPTDYYAPEYVILAVLYFFIALLYIVNSQIDVPTEINDWFRANPDFINLSLATLYSFISIVYIVFFHLPQDTLMQSRLKMFGTFIILLILVYSWTKIITRQSMYSVAISSWGTVTSWDGTYLSILLLVSRRKDGIVLRLLRYDPFFPWQWGRRPSNATITANAIVLRFRHPVQGDACTYLFSF